MKKEELNEIIKQLKPAYIEMAKEAIKQANLHMKPSNETRKMFENLKIADNKQNEIIIQLSTEFKHLVEEIKELKIIMSEQKNGCFIHSDNINRRFREMEKQMEETCEKKADKWVERSVKDVKSWKSETVGAIKFGKWIVGLLGASNIILIISLLIKNYNG